MMKTDFVSAAPDGAIIHGSINSAGEKPQAVLLLLHGMAEHSGRYDAFSDFLANRGIAVYRFDLRGHGKTAGRDNNFGFFHPEGKYDSILSDIDRISEMIGKEYPHALRIIMGHSMGSFIAMAYQQTRQQRFHAMILSGTAAFPLLLLQAGRTIASIQAALSGKKHRSKLLYNMTFASYNNKFRPAETPNDWLSVNRLNTREYASDPSCGFVCSASMYRELFRMLLFIQKASNIKKMNAEMPVLVFAGKNDAMGNFGKAPAVVVNKLNAAGVVNTEFKLFENARHEVLNEDFREEVFEMVVQWVHKNMHQC